MRNLLVDKALADVGIGGGGDGGVRRQMAQCLLFFDALGGVRQQVVGIAGSHEAGAGQGEGHARGVEGDPAPAPLLGHVGGGARTAGRVQHQIAGVSGHEETALDNQRACFNDIVLITGTNGIIPINCELAVL